MQNNLYGTKITDLQQTENARALNNRQHEELEFKRDALLEPFPRAQPQVRIPTQAPQHPTQLGGAPQHAYLANKIDMDRLIRNIQDTLPQKKSDTMTLESEDETDYVNKKMGWYKYLGEFAIFIIIYFILSQGVIKRFVGKYINIINPVDGKVSNVGILVYGIINAIIFILTKHFTIGI